MKIPSNLFAQIVEKSLDGIWLTDINNNTMYVNQITSEMMGYDPAELMQKKFSDLMEDNDWAMFSERLNSRKTGVSEHHEVRFLKKDGTPLWVRAACNPLYNDNGDYVGSVGLLSDISETRKDEIILHAQRNVFEKLVNGSSLQEGLLELLKPIDQLVNNVRPSILLLDEENRLREGASINLNPEYEKVVDGHEIGPDVGSCGTSAYEKRLIITEDTLTDPHWAKYRDLARKYGLRSCWSSPIINKSGKVLGTFAMYFDKVRKPTPFEIQIVKDFTAAATLCIEHVRLLETEIKHHKKMDLLAEVRGALSTTMEYEEVLKKIPQLLVDRDWASWSFISLKNTDGVFRTISVASLPGLKEVLGPEIMEFDLTSNVGISRVIRENKPLVENYSSEKIKGMLEALKSEDVKRKNLFEKLWGLNLQSVIAIPLEVRGEVIGGFLLASNDPAKLYSKADLDFMMEIARSCIIAIDNGLLYRETKQSVKAREDFISIASHELRTPLTSLKMRIDLLGMMIDRGKLPEEVRTSLKPVVAELRPDVIKFTRLIETLLDFSKLGGNKLHLSIENCNLSQVLHEEIQRIMPEFILHKTDLVVDIQEKIFAECDQVRVQQVVNNLLMNALKFGNQKPVTLIVTADEFYIHIKVKDQGIGISPQDATRIFKPFERAVSEKHFGGLGLGLYITKQIVERHAGVITVESKPQEGTTFYAMLPVVQKK